MLDATSTTVATQTTYTIPGNRVLIDDDTSPTLIRPTSVTVAERDGTIETFAFAGPRQLGAPATGTHDSDARDTGRRVIGLNEVDLGDAEDDLVNQAMMLHLRSTTHVLTDAETREVLAKYGI